MSVLKKHNLRTILTISAALLLSAFLLSCAGAPEHVSAERPVHFLPDNAQLLGKMDTASNKELFSEIVHSLMPEEQDIGQALERTDNLFFTLHEGDIPGRPAVSFIIQGNFPKVLTESMLKKGDGWEKRTGGISWWQNGITGMEFSVPERDLIFFSQGKMDEMIANYSAGRIKPIAYEVIKEMEVSDLVLYMGDPGTGLLKGLPVDTDKFPLISLWFTLFKGEEEYLLSGVFLLKDAEQSKAMAMLSKIFLVGWFRQNKLATVDELKENMEIAAAGRSVRIRGISLGSEEVLRMIFSFIPKEDLAVQ